MVWDYHVVVDSRGTSAEGSEGNEKKGKKMNLPKGIITNSRTTPDLIGYKRRVAARGRVRHERGKMNKSEAAYAAKLSARIVVGEVADWWFERVTLLLADKPEGTDMKGTRYTPDFMVQLADGTIEFHEVKGGWAEGDAIVKFKVAVEQYPIFRFVWITKGT